MEMARIVPTYRVTPILKSLWGHQIVVAISATSAVVNRLRVVPIVNVA